MALDVQRRVPVVIMTWEVCACVIELYIYSLVRRLLANSIS